MHGRDSVGRQGRISSQQMQLYLSLEFSNTTIAIEGDHLKSLSFFKEVTSWVSWTFLHIMVYGFFWHIDVAAVLCCYIPRNASRNLVWVMMWN